MSLVSTSKKFIFIHIYKNAGTSIRSALSKYHNPDYNFHDHSKAATVKQALGTSYNNFISFAVVRNPWAWHISLYLYRIRVENDPWTSSVTFDQYIRWKCKNDVELQSDFVLDADKQQIVSCVLRFENLAKEFKELATFLRLPDELPRENTSHTRDYTPYYTPETIDLVAEHYREDIDRFNYTFDKGIKF